MRMIRQDCCCHYWAHVPALSAAFPCIPCDCDPANTVMGSIDSRFWRLGFASLRHCALSQPACLTACVGAMVLLYTVLIRFV